MAVRAVRGAVRRARDDAEETRAREPDTAGATPRAARIVAPVETDPTKAAVDRVHLGAATALREDLTP